MLLLYMCGLWNSLQAARMLLCVAWRNSLLLTLVGRSYALLMKLLTDDSNAFNCFEPLKMRLAFWAAAIAMYLALLLLA